MIRKIDYPRAQARWVRINAVTIRGMKAFVARLYERHESGFGYVASNESYIRIGQTYAISDIYSDGVVLDRRYVVPFFILKLVK